MNEKLILNWLPPANINSPAISLSILKTYMQENKVETKVIYWNELFNRELKKYFGIKSENDSAKLLPFIGILNNIKNNTDNTKRILTALQAIKPDYKFQYSGDYTLDFNTLQQRLIAIINKALQQFDFEKVKLIGFSIKFNQWIPAIVIAKIIKQNHPDVKIVIGGFGQKKAAKQMLEYSNFFDFAIWGEGEDPLLQLFNKIERSEDDFDKVPGLVYRLNSDIIISQQKRNYTNINNYTPCFNDFFDLSIIKNTLNTDGPNNIVCLINSIRGCKWNRCKFCVLNEGYKYRETDIDVVVRQIEEYIKKYHVYKFEFVDNDIIGKERNRFIKLSEELIKLSSNLGKKIEIYSEVLPTKMNSELIKTMKLAGFEKVQIGFEALTDNLLKRMDKEIGFADSILFIKFAIKYGITVSGTNVLMGIPSELEEDVHESINNLHFLRFFMGPNVNGIKLNNSQIGIYNGSRFFKELDKTELEKWNSNIIYDIIPKDSFDNDRFANFGFVNKLYPNFVEWEKFISLNSIYEKSNCSYRLIDNDSIIYYYEYYNGELVKSITFDEPIYWDCLKFTNNQVQDFKSLYDHLETKYDSISPSKVKDILYALKNDFLIYFNSDQSQIVSIIDTNLTR